MVLGTFIGNQTEKKKTEDFLEEDFLSILTAYNHLLEILVTVLYTQGCK